MLLRVAAALCALGHSRALDNGLVRTPWMGWSAWEVFRATTPAQSPSRSLGEKLIKATADALVDHGFAAAGYKVVWVDDAWASKARDNATGALVPDPARWPNGLKSVVDYVHSKGLLFGLYGDMGPRTCAGYPGLQRTGMDPTKAASFAQDAQQVQAAAARCAADADADADADPLYSAAGKLGGGRLQGGWLRRHRNADGQDVPGTGESAERHRAADDLQLQLARLRAL